jgi:hypothetical protein
MIWMLTAAAGDLGAINDAAEEILRGKTRDTRGVVKHTYNFTSIRVCFLAG